MIASRGECFFQMIKNGIRGISMLRTCAFLVAALFVTGNLSTASAQMQEGGAKSSKMRLSTEKLRDMKAKWSANKAKLRACRKEVKAKGLAGDDRWFYIEDCMGKS
jgi:hypothetical protein